MLKGWRGGAGLYRLSEPHCGHDYVIVSAVTTHGLAAMFFDGGIRDGTYIFPAEANGEPVRNVGKAFRAAAERAGLQGVTPHTIRHTAGTWAWEETDPQKVARFLGHRNAKTTENIYAHPRAGFATDAARAVDLKVVRGK